MSSIQVLSPINEQDPIKTGWKQIANVTSEQLQQLKTTQRITLDNVTIVLRPIQFVGYSPMGQSTPVVVATNETQTIGLLLETNDPQPQYIRFEEIPNYENPVPENSNHDSDIHENTA